MMNGQRHPPSAKCSAPTELNDKTVTVAKMLPTNDEELIIPAYKPRRWDGACSTTKVAAPVYSPPAENP